MKFLHVLSLLTLCVFTQRVRGDGHTGVVITEDNCEDWYGDGGCEASCISPSKRCCISYGAVCIPDCPLAPGYCVPDPDFCVVTFKKVCDIVPKKVCVVKPVCKKVKDKVCKWVYEDKCDWIDDEKCEEIEKCDTVPKCYWKDDCDGGFARASSSAVGFGRGSSASASGTAFAGGDFAAATGDASANGRFSRADVDTTARTGGCRKVQVCDDDKKCWKDKICKPFRHHVCKKDRVWKCFDDWKTVCVNKDFCEFKDEKVCKLKEVKVCKDPVKCYDKHCGWGEKCNPDCCPEKKIPICIVVKVPFIVKGVHG